MQTVDSSDWLPLFIDLEQVPPDILRFGFDNAWVIKQITEPEKKLPLHDTCYCSQISFRNALFERSPQCAINCTARSIRWCL